MNDFTNRHINIINLEGTEDGIGHTLNRYILENPELGKVVDMYRSIAPNITMNFKTELTESHGFKLFLYVMYDRVVVFGVEVELSSESMYNPLAGKLTDSLIKRLQIEIHRRSLQGLRAGDMNHIVSM